MADFSLYSKKIFPLLLEDFNWVNSSHSVNYLAQLINFEFRKEEKTKQEKS